MITVYCRFCKKEFKSLILEQSAASLDVTTRATTHVAERHPVEAQKYAITLNKLVQILPTTLLYNSLLEIDKENTYMQKEINSALDVLRNIYFQNYIPVPPTPSISLT